MSTHNVQEELKKSGVQPRGSIAVIADDLVMPLTHSVILKTAGSDAETLSLADGKPGQELTITLVGGAGDCTLAPDTLTGFTNLVLADTKDTVTLKYIDDTVGWIFIGATGTAAPPVIS